MQRVRSAADNRIGSEAFQACSTKAADCSLPWRRKWTQSVVALVRYGSSLAWAGRVVIRFCVRRMETKRRRMHSIHRVGKMIGDLGRTEEIENSYFVFWPGISSLLSGRPYSTRIELRCPGIGYVTPRGASRNVRLIEVLLGPRENAAVRRDIAWIERSCGEMD